MSSDGRVGGKIEFVSVCNREVECQDSFVNLLVDVYNVPKMLKCYHAYAQHFVCAGSRSCYKVMRIHPITKRSIRDPGTAKRSAHRHPQTSPYLRLGTQMNILLDLDTKHGQWECQWSWSNLPYARHMQHI